MRTPKISTLRHHIEANFYPAYTDKTVDGMVKTVNSYLNGRKQLEDEIAPNSGVMVSDLLEDLRLPCERSELRASIYRKAY